MNAGYPRFGQMGSAIAGGFARYCPEARSAFIRAVDAPLDRG